MQYYTRVVYACSNLTHIKILVAIAATLPASSAGCESEFSTQNGLRTKLRNRLLELLEGYPDILMLLLIESLPIANLPVPLTLERQ